MSGLQDRVGLEGHSHGIDAQQVAYDDISSTERQKLNEVSLANFSMGAAGSAQSGRAARLQLAADKFAG